MSLRTTALVAGVIGVLLLAAGLIAESQRPPRDVTASADVDTAIVVYAPEMVAFAGESRIGFSGDGEIIALTARPVDAAAWLDGREATEVTGLPEWETLSTSDYVAPAAPEPTASASPSTSPSASASPSPTPTASPSPSASADAEADEVDVLAESSQDHWRDQRRGEERLSIKGSDVPPGEMLVVVSAAGTPLASTDLALTRDVQDGWITPLIWWGAFLLLVGIIALVLRFIDLRPAQAKGEEWMAKRQRVGEGDEPRPGSRRARREAGEGLPEPQLDEESIAAGTAARASAATPASAPSAPSAPSHPATPGTGQTPATPASSGSDTTPPSDPTARSAEDEGGPR